MIAISVPAVHDARVVAIRQDLRRILSLPSLGRELADAGYCERWAAYCDVVPIGTHEEDGAGRLGRYCSDIALDECRERFKWFSPYIFDV